MKLHVTEEQVKLIELNFEKAIYEGGWWMTRKDYDFLNEVDQYGIPVNRLHTILDRHKETKQITWAWKPNF